MSVLLLIQHPEPAAAQSVPIATEAVYATEWLGTAGRLGLTWLPRFQAGAAVARDDLGEVISEFDAMHEQFRADGKLQPADRAKVVADALRSAAVASPMPDVFIG